MIILTNKKLIKYIIIASIILAIIFIFGTKIIKTKKTIIVSARTQKLKYEILVDVEESKLYMLQNGKIIKTYSCSGGKWETPSPIGTWQIIQKAKWGEGFRTGIGWD